MGWPDPTGGEHVIVLGTHGVYRLDDLRLGIGNDACFGQPDTGFIVEFGRDVRQVRVLDAAG